MKQLKRIKKITRKMEQHMTASQMMVFGFAAVILLGGILPHALLSVSPAW